MAARVSVSKDPFAEQVERAYTLLLSGKVARAFDLTREDPRLRDRYGRHMYGQSLLLARRLVGAGVPVVQVNMGRVQTWDTHSANFKSLKDRLLPPTDQGVSALDRRPADAGDARRDAGRRDRRVRPYAAHRREHGQQQHAATAAITGRPFSRRHSPAAACAEARRSASPTRWVPIRPAAPTPRPTWRRRFTARSASTRPPKLRDRLNRPIQLCTGQAITPLFTG